MLRELPRPKVSWRGGEKARQSESDFDSGGPDRSGVCWMLKRKEAFDVNRFFNVNQTGGARAGGLTGPRGRRKRTKTLLESGGNPSRLPAMLSLDKCPEPSL